MSQEVKAQRKKADDERSDHGKGNRQTDVADTQKAVAECIHHVQYGICFRELLPKVPEQMDGIKHPPR